MITSTDNRQMKRISQLLKKAKARKQEGVFVVEGIRMFAEAPRDWVTDIYVSDTFLQDPERKRMLADRAYEVVADSVLKSISDTQTPQGILCLVKSPVYRLEQLLQKENPQLLILESIQDPGNLGTMLRSGEGAGITGVVMNRTTVDLFNPKTIRSTMGSIYRVPYFVTDHLTETIAELKLRHISVYAAHLQGTVFYDEPDYCGGTAFLIGNEGNGLSEEIAGLADAKIRIPMEGNVESLNAAISASLLMYEVSRQRRRKERVIHENLV